MLPLHSFLHNSKYSKYFTMNKTMKFENIFRKILNIFKSLKFKSSNLNIHFIISLQYNYYFRPSSEIFFFKNKKLNKLSNFPIGCSRLHYAKLHIISINRQIETILSETTSARITQLKRSQTSLIQARLYVLSTREIERNQTCW